MGRIKYWVRYNVKFLVYVKNSFAATLLPRVKTNTTNFADLHRLTHKIAFQSVFIRGICGKINVWCPSWWDTLSKLECDI